MERKKEPAESKPEQKPKQIWYFVCFFAFVVSI